MKYVIIKTRFAGMTRKLPIIFPDDLSHKDIAEAVIKGCPELQFGEVVSAGSLSSLAIDEGYIHETGSVTLKLNGDPEDSKIIRMVDYYHGIGE